MLAAISVDRFLSRDRLMQCCRVLKACEISTSCYGIAKVIKANRWPMMHPAVVRECCNFLESKGFLNMEQLAEKRLQKVYKVTSKGKLFIKMVENLLEAMR
jgi:predicted transcriptional regulator